LAEVGDVEPKGDPIPGTPGKGPRINLKGQFGITLFFSGLATLVFMLAGKALDLHPSKAFFPLLAFPLNLLIVLVLFPRKLRAPFGEVTAAEMAGGIGLYWPARPARAVLLGVVLAALTLAGMLFGSLLTGRYVLDWGNLSFGQVAFATVPGVWEEVFYRGIMMMVLLFALKDVRKAMVVQCVVFGLAHFRGLGLWELVDLFSVALIALVMVYAIHRTNVLLPAIVLHFLHDAFIFLVQVPDGDYVGTYENTVFYACLWAMLGVCAVIVRVATDRWEIGGHRPLYDLSKAPA
jgi:membrane protease YdiL (CAAX protease family)